MNQILVAFIAGLTTGGLSCLAVQGGLLASSLANQIEQNMLEQSQRVTGRSNRKGIDSGNGKLHKSTALPILFFLGAKLIAYTFLGFLLGWLGSMLTLTPITRAILLFVIGVFMIGNALRMLNVHPVFRLFALQPPAFITRYIRKKARTGAELVTPVFLGFLTVFIPCGVTQAMMAVALGTGNPLMGAAILFAFTLGASPVFFVIAYLATQLGSRLERVFMRFVAIVVLVLGFVSIENGLNLMGSPFSATNLLQNARKIESPPEITLPEVNNVLTLTAANNGYLPQVLHAKANEAVVLNVVTKNTQSCSRAFVIPKLNFEKLLPVTGTVPIDIPPQEPGTELFFTCSMGMYSGKIIFQLPEG